ncbi:MAG: hypothetical protein JWM36_3363 [Hyphomicrobiales bacterium]|nr:hypothetical protein [Hyphomicrobiales bacterium]
MAHIPADDEVLKNTFANLAFENYEIGAYKSLIAMAEAFGETNAEGLLRQSLEEEEERMAEWISANVAENTKQFLSLRARGVQADR